LFKHLISSVQLLGDGENLLEIFAFNKSRKQEKKKIFHSPFCFSCIFNKAQAVGVTLVGTRHSFSLVVSFTHNIRKKVKTRRVKTFFLLLLHLPFISRIVKKRVEIQQKVIQHYNISSFFFLLWDHDKFNNNNIIDE